MLRQSIRLAFVAALQHLPAKQRAVLLLADVLGWSAAEAAETLGLSVAAVNSALQRARATLAARDLGDTRVAGAAEALSAAQASLVERYLHAFERYDVDALVGTFGEATRPSCYGFGETLFQVFTEMATRRLQADRFYTKDFNAATYTAEGIAWVSNASMKSVLLRAYPQLKDTKLAASHNAFYPWN